MTHATTRVELASRAYDVKVGAGALRTLGTMLGASAQSGAARVFVVHDSGVPSEHLDTVLAAATEAGLAAHATTITPSEQVKSLATYESLLVDMLEHGHTRKDPVIALGGGIVGDITGFAAASVLRGVPVIQCPTTLLAMVDASVGGKTGVNLRVPSASGEPELLKNMVGAFHQPHAVLADVITLASLDDRVFGAGLAECVKHACIGASVGDPDLLDWTLEHAPGITKNNPDALRALVHRNVELKARVVERDEREDPSARAGGRMLLNLGHTFAHALETVPTLSPDPENQGAAPLMHGEAVSLGLVAAFGAAAELGMIPGDLGGEVASLLGSLGLPTCVASLPDRSTLIERMTHDKKAHGSSIRLVLPESRGACTIVDDAPERAIAAGFDAIA